MPLYGCMAPPPLPRHLQILIKRAEKQPDVYLGNVVRKCNEDGGNNFFSHPQVLRLFVEQLNSPFLEASLRKRVTAMEAILAIAMALPHLDEHGAMVLDQAVAQAWPNVWEWFKDYLGEVKITPPGDPEAGMRMQGLVANILQFLLRQPMSKTTIARTEGVLGLAMDMYLNLPKRPAILPAWDAKSESPVSICNIVIALVVDRSTDLNDVLHKLPSNKKNASTLIFGPLHCAVFGGKDWNRLRLPVTQVLWYILLKSPAFFCRLSLKHIVIQICELLSRMVNDLSQDKNPNPSPGLIESIATLLRFIRQYATEVPQDHSWVIIAGNHGLLSSALNAAALSQDHFSITSLGLLVEHFAAYSLYRPVLRRLRMVLEMEGEPRKAIKDYTFWVHWEKLLKAVEYSQTAYSEFDGLDQYALRCQHPTCCKKLDSARPKRCTGCDLVYYCSTICQTSDWRSHRQRCGSNRPYRDYLSSPRNRKFLEYLTDREMTAHSDLIITKRDQFLSKANVKLPLVLRVDFTSNVPPAVDVYEKRNFVNTWFDHRSSRRMPLIAPFIELRSGNALRPISISNERSGSMFGWLNENADCDGANAVE